MIRGLPGLHSLNAKVGTLFMPPASRVFKAHRDLARMMQIYHNSSPRVLRDLFQPFVLAGLRCVRACVWGSVLLGTHGVVFAVRS